MISGYLMDVVAPTSAQVSVTVAGDAARADSACDAG